MGFEIIGISIVLLVSMIRSSIIYSGKFAKSGCLATFHSQPLKHLNPVSPPVPLLLCPLLDLYTLGIVHKSVVITGIVHKSVVITGIVHKSVVNFVRNLTISVDLLTFAMIESNNFVSTAHSVIGKYFRDSNLKDGTKVQKEDGTPLKARTRVRISFSRDSQRIANNRTSINSSSSSSSSSSTSTSTSPQSPLEDLDEQLNNHLINILNKTINHLFECGDNSLSAPYNAPKYLPKLDDFIGRLYRRGNLTLVNLLTAFLYLIRLKELRPTCKGGYGSGHRLFLAALVLANKYLQDGAYHNKTWYKVIEGVYSLDEINQMERELLGLLNYELCVTKVDWLEFIRILDGKVTRSWARCGIIRASGFLIEKGTKHIDAPI